MHTKESHTNAFPTKCLLVHILLHTTNDLIRKYCLNQLLIIHIPALHIHSLEQLIHLVIAHLLPQVREDIPQLPHADEARELLVEDLEAARVR